MGFAAESRERARPVLPLAGMVDILFLLLIFFMSTYSMREQELLVDVGLPTSTTAEPGTTQAQKVVVTFDDAGRVFLGERLVPIDKLEEEVGKLAAINADQPVIVRGDAAGDFGLFVQIVDAANNAGLTDVSMAAQEQEQ